MGKNKSDAEGKVRKVRTRPVTRAQAEKALSRGADPNQYTKHANYHVRRRAWQIQGRPLPENVDEQNKFLVTLQGTPAPKDNAALPGFYALIRQRILKEIPVKEESITPEDAEYLKGEPVSPVPMVQVTVED